MKIAVNTRFLLHNKLEGIGWHTFEIVRRMVASHPEDEFYFLFDRPYHQEFLFGPNVYPVVLYPPARHPLLFYLWFEVSVTRALRRIKPDVFYSPDGFLATRTRVPTLLTIHDLAYLHFPEHLPGNMLTFYRWMMPRYIRRADHIVTVSQYSKKDLMAHFDKPANQISVVFNGVRPIFHPGDAAGKQAIRDQITGGHPYYLYVGSMHPRKNIVRLLDAFRLVKEQDNQNLHLVLAGRLAWKSSPIRDALEQHPYRQHIHLAGSVSDERMAELYRGALALVYPSLFEGFGMPVAEAMACHTLPVISTTSSLPEVGGDAAIYVDPTDTGSLIRGMQQAATTDTANELWIAKVDQQVSKFNWEESANQVYIELCNLSEQ